MNHPTDRAAVIAHIQSELEARHPSFYVRNLRVGQRRDYGVYSYYDVEYWCANRFPGLSGSNKTEFRFDNDDEDAALRSASL